MAQPQPYALVERKPPIAVVTMNKPERLNAFTYEERYELVERFRELERDDAVRVVILTGAGRGFCSGADVMALEFSPIYGRDAREKFYEPGGHFILPIYDFEKPLIRRSTGRPPARASRWRSAATSGWPPPRRSSHWHGSTAASCPTPAAPSSCPGSWARRAQPSWRSLARRSMRSKRSPWASSAGSWTPRP